MIDYKNSLNPAQYEAATTLEGPVLVIAGAGSGKTRTIVYRLAHLVESGVPASSILLLTFTRKASQEMLDRAKALLAGEANGQSRESATMPGLYTHAPGSLALEVASVQGGTFHSFAFSILRLFQPEGYARRLTVMDSPDMLSALHHCRDELKVAKGDRSFPKNQTLLSYLSKSRNKEMPLDEILSKEAHHLLPHAASMESIAVAYSLFKREKGLLDYDDLLFCLEETLRTRPEALAYCRNKFRYIMVDEYQDTNPVQARLAALLAGGEAAVGDAGVACGVAGCGNIMVVGDDAQSIYAFRGADVRNILRFPEIYPNCTVIRLEENYRSTQPVLDLANGILEKATQGFQKNLFTNNEGDTRPNVIRPLSDRSQGGLVVSRIADLMRRFPAREIAVLFRSGFHSYHVEIQLNKLGIRFRKYGGIRYAEASHVKDAMSFIRLVQNPLDFVAFSRIAAMSKGVGPKTCLKVYQAIVTQDSTACKKILAKYPDLAADLMVLDGMRATVFSPAALLSQVIEHIKARLPLMYPDDHPRRMQGLEQLVLIASSYADLDVFIADLSLDDPLHQEEENNTVVLSTIHSAKGLEWSAVIILDLVEERFPSRHSMLRADDFEEERRLMYVACTRAREHLDLFVPASVYDKASGGTCPALPSPFVRELDSSLYVEWREDYTGGLTMRTPFSPLSGEPSFPRPAPRTAQAAFMQSTPGRFQPEASAKTGPSSLPDAPAARPEQCGFCRHKLFGRGKIVQHLPPDKYRVNFPGIGLKVIMAAYLTIEE